MELWTYLNERVEINDIYGQTFRGKVTGYDSRFDNESGEDSLNLKVGYSIYDFDESKIKSIKVLS